jgi:hypothetical protein
VPSATPIRSRQFDQQKPASKGWAAEAEKIVKRLLKVAKLLAPLRELRDALEFRWTKRTYSRCYPWGDPFAEGSYKVTHVESVEPKRWQKFVLRLLSGLRHAAGGNPNRCPITGTRYSLPLEARQALRKRGHLPLTWLASLRRSNDASVSRWSKCSYLKIHKTRGGGVRGVKAGTPPIMDKSSRKIFGY